MLSHILPPVTSTIPEPPAPDTVAGRALAALGETADAVAYALTAAGFTGKKISADRCPIGNYVRASDPRITDVSVGVDAVRVWTGTPLGIPAPVALPDAVRTFLARFDAGDYHGLHALSGEAAPAVRPDPAVAPGVVESPMYPMPAPADDARFTFGLTSDVGKVLAEHGYPPIRTGADLIGLQQALFGFLYTLAPTGPAASPLPSTLADPGTPVRGEDVGQGC